MSKDQEAVETEIILEASDDEKTVTLTIRSEEKITTADLVETLEYYLSEIIRAHDQKSKPGTEVH